MEVIKITKKEFIIFLAINLEVNKDGALDSGTEIHDKFWKHVKDSHKEDFANMPVREVLSRKYVDELFTNARKWKEFKDLLES